IWNTYLARSTTAGSAYAQLQVSDRPNHVGPVCVMGDSCLPGTRDLFDLFELAIDPGTRRVAVAYMKTDYGPVYDPGKHLHITGGPYAGDYPAAELTLATPIEALSDQKINGSTTYLGDACDKAHVPRAVHDADPLTDEIAVVIRGNCLFTDKLGVVKSTG